LIYDASAMTVGNLTVGMASSACCFSWGKNWHQNQWEFVGIFPEI
jgi:hypothetical protein